MNTRLEVGRGEHREGGTHIEKSAGERTGREAHTHQVVSRREHREGGTHTSRGWQGREQGGRHTHIKRLAGERTGREAHTHQVEYVR